MYLQAHHLKVVERLKALFLDDPRYLALLVGGSLVKGWKVALRCGYYAGSDRARIHQAHWE